MTTRERILTAAAELIRTRGLAGTTTKEIARAAGVAEGTIYTQFQDKSELIGLVVRDRLGGFVPALKELHERVGTGTVRGNLVRLGVLACDFYRAAMPISAALFAEPGLLAAQRAGNRARDAGPHRAPEAVADYLAAEAHAGRLAADADPRALADLLLGACFQHSYLHGYAGTEPSPATTRRHVGRLVDALLTTAIP